MNEPIRITRYKWKAVESEKMGFSRRPVKTPDSSECSVLIVKSKLLQDYFLVLSNEDHKDNHFLILQRLVLRAYWRLL